MDWNDETLRVTAPEHGWWQATVAFPGAAGVTREAAVFLTSALAGRRFHFLRKEGKLRLRTEYPAGGILDDLAAVGKATGWVRGIYEPETEAFGGPLGMDVAHEVFCADSPPALAETGEAYARERAVLLVSTMHRAAGIDPFEIGDVWARVAALRPVIEPPESGRLQVALSAIRRLMNADAARRENAGPGWSARVAAFEEAGRSLGKLNADGLLTRGLRAVLAHHVIFAFNRAAVPVAEQSAAAWLARYASFTDDEQAAASARSIAHLTELETTITTITEPAELRADMVARLTQSGHLRTPAITEAFSMSERHAFVPDAEAEAAYQDDAVSIKHGPDGEMISCISAPSIVATQLEQLDPHPGHKILEAGAATGYNADLLGRLVQPGGHVWTLDVDQDLVDNAAANLAVAGASNVTVVLGDGATGLPEHAPYDRIQFTVGAGDVPAAVLEQLAPGGRLVIPMRIRGSISRSFAFERDGDMWKTVSCEMATFVPLRKGICDDVYTLVRHEGAGNVRLETFSEQQVDRDAMTTILDTPATKAYTGVKFRQGDPWQWVYLWLACVLPNGLSRMPGQRPGFTPHFGWGSMAALDAGALAYLTVREGEDGTGRFWEIGVIGHGTGSAALTDQVVSAISEWSRDLGNGAPEPGFLMAKAAHRDRLTAADPRFVIDKPYSRLVIDWT